MGSHIHIHSRMVRNMDSNDVRNMGNHIHKNKEILLLLKGMGEEERNVHRLRSIDYIANSVPPLKTISCNMI
jgi:hypothetical protein